MSGKPDLDKIRRHIEANHDRPIPLAELGRLVQLSPFTVQRLFKQSLGVSPLQYQRALRAGSLRNALKQGDSVTNAIYNAGFGSSSRGYDGAQLGMTPARFAAGGRGEQIGWCCAWSAFGWVIVGATQRGLCWLSLAGRKAEAEASLREEFPAATLKRDPALETMVDAVLRVVGGQANTSEKLAPPQVATAGFARDGVSVEGVAGAAADSSRRDQKLQPAGARIGRSQGDPRRSPRLRHKSRGDCGSLSSRGGRERLTDRLSLGHRAQAAAAGCGKRMLCGD